MNRHVLCSMSLLGLLLPVNRNSAQDAPTAPAAITHKVFIGCSTCNTSACTLSGLSYCNGDTSGGNVTTIAAGDSVNFTSTSPIHNVVQGGANPGVTFLCNSGTGASCTTVDPNASPVFYSGNPGITNYTFRFDRPGTYNYFCQIHACSNMRGTIVVTPATAPCTGADCQNPLLKFAKIAPGQDLATVCGYGAPASPPNTSGVTSTTLCWNGQSSSPLTPGTWKIFRDTQPDFAAPSPDFLQLTNDTRRSCAPNYTDVTVLPAGKAIFYYRICDSAGCADN